MSLGMKFLIVGYGSIGKRHLYNLDILGYKDVLVYDKQPEVLEGIKRPYHDLDEALAESPDVAIIANPTAYHIPAALAAANIGTHLLIEKPVSHTLEGLKELLAVVREYDLVTMVAYSLRFFKGIIMIREILSRGTIGKPLYVHAEAGQYLPDWRPGSDYRKIYSACSDQGGGVTLDLSHELDYLLWLFGPVCHVSCVEGKVSNLDINVEDTTDILMEHENGVISAVHLDYLQRVPTRCCKVVGSEGTLIWDNSDGAVRVFDTKQNQWQNYDYHTDRNDMYLDELQHFIQCVIEKEQTIIPLEAGIQVLQLALVAKKAASEGLRQGVDDVL
jgi:predicted dehydrogenase